MVNNRYDWSVGNAAKDFTQVADELGGVDHATPGKMKPKLDEMGYGITYDQLKSRLQAERKKLHESRGSVAPSRQSPAVQISGHTSVTTGYDSADTPFMYSTPPDIAHPIVPTPHPQSYPLSSAPRQPRPNLDNYPKDDNNIFTISGATDIELEHVSGLLASELSKMSIEESNKDDAMTKQESQNISGLPSFNAQQLWQDDHKTGTNASNPMYTQSSFSTQQLWQLQNGAVYTENPVCAIAAPDAQECVSMDQDLPQILDCGGVPTLLDSAQLQLDDRYTLQSVSLQFYNGEQTLQRSEMDDYDQFQQFSKQNKNQNRSPLSFDIHSQVTVQQEVQTPDAQYAQYVQQLSPFEKCTGSCAGDSVSFGDRTIITGDPSTLQRWQN